MSVTVTSRDRALLSLIARGESSSGGDPYTSVYPNTSEPRLTEMTLSQVQQYQRRRISQGFPSSAVGRYQFIQDTLTESIGYISVDPDKVRFTPMVQDALIIARLKRFRKYDTWLSTPTNDDVYLREQTGVFMLNLAREFASIPVPYQVTARGRTIQKGQSYYANDGLNRAHHDPDRFFQNLIAIRKSPSENVASIDYDSPGNQSRPPQGVSNIAQVNNQAYGTSIPTGGSPGSPIQAVQLPGVEEGFPYSYRSLRPNDSRYDFRVGKKVNSIFEDDPTGDSNGPSPITNT